ncbi:MAG TPA: hypothetical protein VNN06_07145 [Ramlibacter sp.]|nr:hypothetical protein [Ramlibacter sp.]
MDGRISVVPTEPGAFVGAKPLDAAAVSEPPASLPERRDARGIREHAGSVLLLLTAGLFTFNVLLHYPGVMSNDAVNQYAEAISGKYTDWHPPVMAWLWSLLRLAGEGPAPFLLLHLAAYWTGFGLLADGMRRRGHPRIAFAIALSGAFPPFLFLNGTIMKDVGMAASWIAAAGVIFWFRAQQRRIPVLCGVLVAALVLYGALVRSNAVFGLGPLLVYALARPAWLRNSRLIAATVFVAALAIPVAQQLNRVLFHPAPKDGHHALFLFDLIGIAAHEGNPSLAAPRAMLNAAQLRACYTPYWWDSFSPWGRCGALVNRPDTDHATWGEGLSSQWAKTVAEHPLAYASHRLKHFNSELLFAVPLKHVRLTPEYRADDPAFKPIEVFSESSLRFDLVRKNPLFWPATWLAWGAFLLALVGRQSPTPPVVLARVLVVSALGYSSAYLVIGIATDMRYYFWPIMAVIAATLLALPLLADGWRSRSATLIGGLAAVGAVMAIGVAARLLDFQRWVS